MSNNCLNCVDRKLFCHSSCEKYSIMKQEIQIIKKMHRQFLDGWGYDGYLSTKNGKAKKYAKTKF